MVRHEGTAKLFSADAEASKRYVPDLVLVVDDDGNTREEVRPMSRSRIVESVIDCAVRGKNGERQNEVIVGANHAELIHGSVVRCDMRLDDFFGFFLEVVECIGIKVIVGPTGNDEAHVCGGILVEIITFAVFLEPADGVDFCGIVWERLLPATLVYVEACLLCAKVLGMRVCKFVCANEFFADGNGLAYAISWLPCDGIGRFIFPIGEWRIFCMVSVATFTVADHENSLFVAANALEHIGEVGKAE